MSVTLHFNPIESTDGSFPFRELQTSHLTGHKCYMTVHFQSSSALTVSLQLFPIILGLLACLSKAQSQRPPPHASVHMLKACPADIAQHSSCRFPRLQQQTPSNTDLCKQTSGQAHFYKIIKNALCHLV